MAHFFENGFFGGGFG